MTMKEDVNDLSPRLRGISLFSGVGGLELALHEEVKTVAYVEREPYAQAVLIKRMHEGFLDKAPIYDDVRTFKGKSYRGVVDIVFGGFPCQDISFAGKGKGIKEGTRSRLWFEMQRIISEIRPSLVFLENVSAITYRGLDTVTASLTEAGYDCRWIDVRASDVGAWHKRERWFCLGYYQPKQQPGRRINGKKDFSNANSWNVRSTFKTRIGERGEWGSELFSEDRDKGFCTIWRKDPAEYSNEVESFVGRVADGVPQGVDRLKCLGNAVVPQQGRLAWRILTNDILPNKSP